MSLNPLIFREYDIRGVADKDLDNSFCHHLGLAIGTYLARKSKQRVVVARDCRLSSDRIHSAIVDGLRETSRTVIDVGVVATPLQYFAVHELDADGGVMITASHNQGEDNGFKVMCGKDTVHGAAIQELRKLVEARDFQPGAQGSYEKQDIETRYIEYVKQNIHLARTDMKIVVDGGNGMGGPISLRCMRALGLDPVPLFCDLDGTFPNHHPDPTVPANLTVMMAKMKEIGADVGIAYDGDADRLGAVDEKGQIVWGDRLMILFSRAVLQELPGATIIGEVKCSQTMYGDIARHGGKPRMWKTGHSLIKAKMKEVGAALAGEMSGHIFFGHRYKGFDDAVYSSLRLLELLSQGKDTLSARLADVPKTFNTPEIRVTCPDTEKFGVVEKVKRHFQRTHEVNDVDGARVRFEGGWGLVRASNTGPVLVLRFEATSEARLAEIRKEVEHVVSEATGTPLAAAGH